MLLAGAAMWLASRRAINRGLAAGKTYRLLGVNRSSGEFACVQGKGMCDGDPSAQANIDAMKTWHPAGPCSLRTGRSDQKIKQQVYA
ncbi:hypothetical protein [Actinoplanes sp. GCM10030250]|uniref:hypothetical protein n=1 Tax=Actinoplanes sp. GCM10030250 TaxID=3273376 RepID=UPI00362373A8